VNDSEPIETDLHDGSRTSSRLGVRGEAQSRVRVVVPPNQSSLDEAMLCYTGPLPLPAKVVSTGAQPSSIGDLAAFTARLNGLRVDQDSDDLSNALRAAFKEHELYNLYISSLVGDTERAKTLLEVFDKVRAATDTVSWVGSQHRCAVQALQTTTHDATIFKQFRQLCGQTGLLPTSHIIPGGLIRTTECPVAYGGFGEVWEGIYDEKRVAIKALRVYKGDDERKLRKVSHPTFLIPTHPQLTASTRSFARR